MVNASAPVIAVTPIIGGKAVKGPAAKMLSELGLEVSGGAVARWYAGLADVFVSDETDALPTPVADMHLLRAQTLMRTTEDRRSLALKVLAAADDWRIRNGK